MNAINSKFSTNSRILLVLAGLCLAISIFVPIWRIELSAPQYPEGLRLFIHSDKLGGDVAIINGLNHYIGMKTLNAEEFIEFKILPYIIGFFALFSLVVAVSGKRKLLYILLTMFILFGVIAMVDFWRWEYDYGHNLDPHAAIIVPGMAYQPPLIGYKQLLNFGAYSIPALGGWLFISAGVLMVLSVLIERKVFARFAKKHHVPALALLVMTLSGCGNLQPDPIKLNKDACEYCKMTISDARFAAELVTAKGRIYKFDDLKCLINYTKENSKVTGCTNYVCDYSRPGDLILVEKAIFVGGEKVGSPMGGNIAAYANKDSASTYAHRFQGAQLSWESIIKAP